MATATADPVASVYAEALVELADEAGAQTKVADIEAELNELIGFVERDPAFAAFLESPIISTDDRRKSLEAIFRARISDLLLHFLFVLNAAGRLGHLHAIAIAYRQITLRMAGRVEVEVFAAEPLSAEVQESVRRSLASSLGADPILNVTVDPSLIGGLKIRLGDTLIDASVATRLRQMRDALRGNGSQAVRDRFSSLVTQGP